MRKEFWVCDECKGELEISADDKIEAARSFRHPAGDARRIDLCSDCWNKILKVCPSMAGVDTAKGF